MIAIAIGIFVLLAILLGFYANLRAKKAEAGKAKSKEDKQVEKLQPGVEAGQIARHGETSKSKQRGGLPSTLKVIVGIGVAVMVYVGLLAPSGLGFQTSDPRYTEAEVCTNVELGMGCMSNIMEPRAEYLGNRIWEVELASCKPPFRYITVYYNEKNGIIASTYAEALKFRWKVDIVSVVSVIAISCVVLLFAALLLGAIERGE